MEKKTMTFSELRKQLKERGMPVGNEALAAGIEQGMYPFAQCFRYEGSSRRQFLIFREPFEAWCCEKGLTA